ncbi:hypothetical protein [Benzoatithermus flavus]|uniref:Uncharacterized protein n=1 Tax=Benzoatithermus flavus TaxID=3108223 RepID=A0ABU8XP78_9PROT
MNSLTPVDLPIRRDEWLELSGQILATWAIFNPNGPTLSCLGWIDRGNGTLQPFYRWLHFLDGKAWSLGTVSTREADWAEQVLDRVRFAHDRLGAMLEPVFTCVPSFVTLAGFEGIDIALRGALKEATAVREADWGRQIYYLRKFGDRLFDRAGEEIREAVEKIRNDPAMSEAQRAEAVRLAELRYGRVRAFATSVAPSYVSAPFSDALFAEWWATVTAPDFVGAGLAQLAQAWVGAIYMVEDTDLLDEVQASGRFTPFEHVRDFLLRFGHGLWPASVSTATLRQELGLPPSLREPGRHATAAASGVAAAENGKVAWEPMFRHDFERFKTIVNTPDVDARAGAYPTLADALLGEILHYGITCDEAFIPTLSGFYSRCIEHDLPASLRHEIERYVVSFVEHGAVSPNAFLPFMVEDPDGGVAATATIDMVSLFPVPDDDPMRVVRQVVGMIRSGVVRNPGALFGALLHLGDRRVTALLRPVRDILAKPAIDVAVRCTTGFISAATIEFYLDWLEERPGDLDDELFGSIASGLALDRRNARSDLVKTGSHPFPVTAVTPEEYKRLGAMVPLDVYTARIAPRLYALYAKEPPPKVMEGVLRIWGLPLPNPTEVPPAHDQPPSTDRDAPMITAAFRCHPGHLVGRLHVTHEPDDDPSWLVQALARIGWKRVPQASGPGVTVFGVDEKPEGDRSLDEALNLVLAAHNLLTANGIPVTEGHKLLTELI